jgi:F-type H+-transporting ATPase subunit b
LCRTGLWVLVVLGAVGLLVTAPLRAADPPGQAADPHAAPAAIAPAPDPAAPAGQAPADADPPAHSAPPQEHAALPAAGHAAPGDHAATDGHGAEHGESPWVTASRLANFALLAGGLWYLLRKPARSYLEARGEEIRGGLVSAAEMRDTAAKQLSLIQVKMAALPGELEALKARGSAETAAEQARIEQQAEAERQRLIEHARRDMDLQVQAARRDLTRHAAALAVEVAERRIAATITDEDQRRLVVQYVDQMTGTRAQGGRQA